MEQGSPKQDFRVLYDYQTGGVWGVVSARSAEEIERKYPVLKVIYEQPPWMSDERYREILVRGLRFDIDDPTPPAWVPND